MAGLYGARGVRQLARDLRAGARGEGGEFGGGERLGPGAGVDTGGLDRRRVDQGTEGVAQRLAALRKGCGDDAGEGGESAVREQARPDADETAGAPDNDDGKATGNPQT